MTQEEKELLLKDLCARLPYKVKVKSSRRTTVTVLTTDIINDFCLGCDVKPFLRPMSSMDGAEVSEYLSIVARCGYFYEPVELIDWLNSKHFDYRGLIPKGLALEVPEGMYK